MKGERGGGAPWSLEGSILCLKRNRARGWADMTCLSFPFLPFTCCWVFGICFLHVAGPAASPSWLCCVVVLQPYGGNAQADSNLVVRTA